MTEPRKLRVFLCHASQDKPVVRELYQRLLAEEWIDPWLDEEKLLPGMNWDLEIEKAVASSDIVIAFLSSNAVSREGYIQRELKFVLEIALEKPEEEIFLIPLRLEECEIPRRLKSWQYADYFPAMRQSSYNRLLASMKLRASSLNIWSIIEPMSIDKLLFSVGHPNKKIDEIVIRYVSNSVHRNKITYLYNTLGLLGIKIRIDECKNTSSWLIPDNGVIFGDWDYLEWLKKLCVLLPLNSQIKYHKLFSQFDYEDFDSSIVVFQFKNDLVFKRDFAGFI
jgi:hypothetical protein